MHIYFVRHGETDLNRAHMHQSFRTPLNSRGLEQARTVGEYLRPMNPDLLLSSNMTRAVETARIIGSRIECAPHTHTRFREIDRPTRLAGKSVYGKQTIGYLLLSYLHRNDPSWRYYDAENFSDIYTRLRETREYHESLSESHQSVVVVSHSVYINLMVASLCKNRSLSMWELFRILASIRKLKNTAVIAMERVEPSGTCGCTWKLVK